MVMKLNQISYNKNRLTLTISSFIYVSLHITKEKHHERISLFQSDCVMEIFKTLLDQVDDEICGAKEYAELALSLKDDSPQLSNMYNDLSKQEYSHIQILHSHLLKVYESFGEQTDMVQNLFDWQNKKIIDGAAHVKTLIDMYK